MRSSYSSFEQINEDLKILKVKRDFHYQKVFRSIDNIKEELAPERIIKNTLGSVTSYVTSSGRIQAFFITAVLKYFFNRKSRK
ncbi:DUF6327 family protein [Myroides injenensis]|uniref:DUF6327 family protein n=1 Tax=Myroides injenensis TaxID=1183151 RepID=UPI002270316B|nr:DUF6327 family protein [Myroides injenensis]